MTRSTNAASSGVTASDESEIPTEHKHHDDHGEKCQGVGHDGKGSMSTRSFGSFGRRLSVCSGLCPPGWCRSRPAKAPAGGDRAGPADHFRSTGRGGRHSLGNAVDARVLTRWNRLGWRRFDCGCEQVAPSGVDALLGWSGRGRGGARWRRRGGSGGRRRRPLIAAGAASRGDSDHCDEDSPAGQSNQARTQAIRSHDQYPVRVATRCGAGEPRVAQSVPVALTLGVRTRCLLSD